MFYSNPRVPCEDIPSVDLRYFKEDPVNGGFPFDQNFNRNDGGFGESSNSIDY